jgi:hypothetical protein
VVRFIPELEPGMVAAQQPLPVAGQETTEVELLCKPDVQWGQILLIVGSARRISGQSVWSPHVTSAPGERGMYRASLSSKSVTHPLDVHITTASKRVMATAKSWFG